MSNLEYQIFDFLVNKGFTIRKVGGAYIVTHIDTCRVTYWWKLADLVRACEKIGGKFDD